jgi:hypothetical protein
VLPILTKVWEALIRMLGFPRTLVLGPLVHQIAGCCIDASRGQKVTSSVQLKHHQRISDRSARSTIFEDAPAIGRQEGWTAAISWSVYFQ